MAQLHHLNCVEIQAAGNLRAIGHCLLIEAGDRLLLIDAGIGLTDVRNPGGRIGQDLIDAVGFRFHEDWTAWNQIARLGLEPGNVTDCVLSHLDPDHAGGLADFPEAAIHVGAEEFQNFNSGNPRYLTHQLAHNPVIKTYGNSGARWFGFDARRISILPEVEILLIPLFGHTLGHCGVAVKCDTDWIFYVGDAYYLRAELTDPAHPVHQLAELRADDNALRLDSLNKIREFVADHPDIAVHGYHDPGEFVLKREPGGQPTAA